MLPSLKPKEKRDGDIALVLVASNQNNDFAILDAKDAAKPAKWMVPFRTSLAMYVYGPSGLSIRKLRGVLEKDNELIAQLAEYAEKTSQTESVLQAISQYENTSAGENLQAALQGFAQQSGINGKLDRSATGDQQMLAAMRTLNPALSAYDPISPSGSQRLGQTARPCRYRCRHVSGQHGGTCRRRDSDGSELKNAAVPRYGFPLGVFAACSDGPPSSVAVHRS